MGAHRWRAGARRTAAGRLAVAAVLAVLAGSAAVGVGVGVGVAEVPTFSRPDRPVEGTPCTARARACVDLDGRDAWLFESGRVVRGPVKVMTGDAQRPTPRGTFTVEWKAQQYTSREFLVQMPYAVFFAPGGIAFHEGRQDTNSAGCVKLGHADAVAWFEHLQVGDEVQVR